MPDPTKFPNGISGVAEQVHALGLKIGIYRWAVCFASDRECDDLFSVAMLVLILVLASPDHWATRSLMPRLLPAGALIISNMVIVIVSQLSWILPDAFADNCNVPSNWTDSSVRSCYILMMRSSSV